jgi:purine-binding chemotaxis protein CheW
MNNETIDNAKHSHDGAEAVDKVQLFRAGQLQFAIFTDEIAAITDWVEPTPLPHAPKPVLGVVSIQGRMLTVLDLAQLTGSEAASGDGSRPHLLALRGDEQLALAVDAIGETIELEDTDFDSKREAGVVFAAFDHAGVETNVVNVKGLFPTAIQGRERRHRRF